MLNRFSSVHPYISKWVYHTCLMSDDILNNSHKQSVLLLYKESVVYNEVSHRLAFEERNSEALSLYSTTKQNAEPYTVYIFQINIRR